MSSAAPRILLGLSLCLRLTQVATAQFLPSSESGSKTLYFDFDGTVSTSDSWSPVMIAAYEALPETTMTTADTNGISSNNSTKVVIPSWGSLLEDFDTKEKAIFNSFGPPSDISQRLAFASSEQHRNLSRESFENVKNSRLFMDANQTQLFENLLEAASKVQLREGWCDLLEDAAYRDVKINVVTLNWSGKFVRAILRTATECPELSEQLVEIYAPEILPDGILEAGPRDREVPLYVGGDKNRLIESMIEDGEEVIFVSDSLGDLEPLWEAPTTIGIVVSSEEKAVTDLESYGKELWDVNNGWQGESGRAGAERGLYLLNTWHELRWFLGWGEEQEQEDFIYENQDATAFDDEDDLVEQDTVTLDKHELAGIDQENMKSWDDGIDEEASLAWLEEAWPRALPLPVKWQTIEDKEASIARHAFWEGVRAGYESQPLEEQEAALRELMARVAAEEEAHMKTN